MSEILDVSKHYKKCHPSPNIVHFVSDKITPLQGWSWSGTGQFGIVSENLVWIFSADLVEKEDQTGDTAVMSGLKCLQVFSFLPIFIIVAH
ncbi:hypothetical protein Y032_0053g2326 [Ancylostoma ceylanicum]|uniref:Uncharacterized protein n=1 Tax=Ancylostoma ceylanicum TaxID=53326 RepID=A0A016U7D5_9BILA|nr:hypothetical protein Y032_0053g2326 [Ancylostoma ceylanicum]